MAPWELQYRHSSFCFLGSLMASLAKELSVFLFFVLFASLQIQARQSRFFSRVIHFGAESNVTEPRASLTGSPSPAPAPAPEPVAAPTPGPAEVVALTPAPAPSYSTEGENGYGLYGGGSDQFTPTKETPTTTEFEDEFLTEELADKRFETGYPKTNLYSSNGNGNKYNNYYSNGYSNNYNGNSYSDNYNVNGNGYSDSYNVNGNGYSENYNVNGNGYSKNYNVNGNGYSKNYNVNGNGYSDNYNGNGYQSEKQGMSDTRFLENGKYHFHVNNENNNVNGYETTRETTKNGGYYANYMYPNELNSMEEYGKQDNQEEFVP